MSYFVRKLSNEVKNVSYVVRKASHGVKKMSDDIEKVPGRCHMPDGVRKVLDGVSYVSEVVRKVSGRCQEDVRWCQDGVRKVSDRDGQGHEDKPLLNSYL